MTTNIVFTFTGRSETLQKVYLRWSLILWPNHQPPTKSILALNVVVESELSAQKKSKLYFFIDWITFIIHLNVKTNECRRHFTGNPYILQNIYTYVWKDTKNCVWDINNIEIQHKNLYTCILTKVILFLIKIS